MKEVPRSIPASGTFFSEDLDISTAIFPLPLIQEEQLMAKEFTLSTGRLPRGGLPRSSVVRLTDNTDMTSAVYRGRIAV